MSLLGERVASKGSQQETTGGGGVMESRSLCACGRPGPGRGRDAAPSGRLQLGRLRRGAVRGPGLGSPHGAAGCGAGGAGAAGGALRGSVGSFGSSYYRLVPFSFGVVGFSVSLFGVFFVFCGGFKGKPKGKLATWRGVRKKRSCVSVLGGALRGKRNKVKAGLGME